MTGRWPDGTRIELLAEVVDKNKAMQVYDATSPSGDTVRVAEHLTLEDCKVRRIAPILDIRSMETFIGA